MGSGDPVVLLHGNPTSSYLWRDLLASPVPKLFVNSNPGALLTGRHAAVRTARLSTTDR